MRNPTLHLMATIKYYINKLRTSDLNKESSIRTKCIDDSYSYLCSKLDKEERLFFVRFGDGEFLTLMKKNHTNYVYNTGLDTELEASFTIRDDNYLISCPINYPYDRYHAKGIYKQFSWQEDMISVLRNKKLDTSIVFENPCIFQCLGAFRPLELKRFLDKYIRPKRKMFIGSTEQAVAEKLYGSIAHYVQIPPQHAYESIDEWWPKIIQNCRDVELIIPSAGSSSNVIAKRLWDLDIPDLHVLDLGSIVDAAASKDSRKWIRLRGHKILQILEPKPSFSWMDKVNHLKKDIVFFIRNQLI